VLSSDFDYSPFTYESLLPAVAGPLQLLSALSVPCMVASWTGAVVLDSKRSHSPLGWSVVSISGTIPGLVATATAPSPKLNPTFSDYQRFPARSAHPILLFFSSK